MSKELVGGRYRALREIGRGNLGTVSEAIDVTSGARVALKVLAVGADRAKGDRFLRGAEVGGRLDHPNVVRVIALGRDLDGTTWLVQELLEGEDLAARIRRGALAPDEVAELVLPALDGLAHIHGGDIVHRDVKPSNVFLARAGDRVVPKLVDFGFAKSGDADAISITATGEALGSPLYMSPEQLRGAPANALSDQWSAAVTVFAALSGGELPFTARTLPELVVKVSRDEPRSLAALGVHPSIAGVVDRALEKDPARRWPSVRARRRAARRAALSRPPTRSTAKRASRLDA